MKFIASTHQLLQQLDLVDGVVVSKPLIPILENFLFEIKEGNLQITTTDLETFMSTSMPVESDGNINIAVPSKVSMDTLKSLPTQPVTFSIDETNYIVEINTGNGRYKLTGHNSEDFQKLPEVQGDNNITLPANMLLKAINKTLFATGVDELRLNLTGVFCQIFDDNINFVATDANRLVRFSKKGTKNGFENSFIMPKKAVTLLKNSLPNDVTPVKIDFNKSYAFFTYGGVSLICRLIDERYPDYNAVIPTENPNKLTIPRLEFISALKRVAIFSNKTTNQIRLKLAGSELNIFAEDYDYANEATERLSCAYEGNDLEIAFNGKYLIEMISNMDNEEIAMEFSLPNRASLILPIKNNEDEEILMLIMPMMINQ
ncbi:MAG: DNA polymerase III subunit beta [Bacteroidetes bacterium]|nr:DNA polymerase III subunit beta [Bacteroidota bacterium]